jgi:hypothetical protein
VRLEREGTNVAVGGSGAALARVRTMDTHVVAARSSSAAADEVSGLRECCCNS